jgi:uncharacterized protein (PEP-CTERM system associated)
MAASPAFPGEWQSTASLGLGATFSDNVFLAPGALARGDLVLRTTPSIGLNREGGRLRFRGTYTPVVLGYVNSTVSDTLFNSLNTVGTIEAVENFLFIEGRALIAQTFISPLGPQPADLANSTVNRIESRTLGISPYITGRLSGGGSYQLREDLSRTTFGAGGLPAIETSRFTANVTDAPGSFVVTSADFLYRNTDLGGLGVTSSRLARGRALFNLEPDFSVSVNAGFESNNYGSRNFSGAVYGAGFEWRPSPRTEARLNVDRRYFGTSFNLDATHRMSNTSFRFRTYRSEQEFQDRGFGLDSLSTRELLDSALTGRFPNPDERAQEVNRQIQAGGLPDSVSVLRPFISARVNRVTGIEPALSFNGLRNSLLLSVFIRETTPITASLSAAQPDPFLNLASIRQRGMSATVTRRLSDATVGTFNVDVINSQGVQNPVNPAIAAPDFGQRSYRATLTRTVSPQTTAAVTLRMLTFSSNATAGARERAMIFTLNHTFR